MSIRLSSFPTEDIPVGPLTVDIAAAAAFPPKVEEEAFAAEVEVCADDCCQELPDTFLFCLMAITYRWATNSGGE